MGRQAGDVGGRPRAVDGATAGALGSEPPQTFSVAWNGYLSIIRPGRYYFATTSDDRSRLYIDNELVVEKAGAGSVHKLEVFVSTADRIT